MPWMRHCWNAARSATRSASNWIDFGVNDLATPRQPERPEVVTHVSGTICYLCVRAGHMIFLAIPAGLEPATRGVAIRYAIGLAIKAYRRLDQGAMET